MSGAAAYGMLYAMAMFLLVQTAQQPWGSMVFFGFVASHMGWGAVVIWTRTGLPFWTMTMVLASLTNVLLVVLASFGRVFPDIPFWAWAVLLGNLVAGIVSHTLERRLHSTRWRAWSTFMEDKSAWDIFTGRHVPVLREPVRPAS